MFSSDGTLLMELGVKLEPGHSERHFCMPTQVRLPCLPLQLHQPSGGKLRS
jgi:hypothetical protein